MVPQCFLCRRFFKRSEYPVHLERHAYNIKLMQNPMVVPPLPFEQKMLPEHYECCFNTGNHFCLELTSSFSQPAKYVHEYRNIYNFASEHDIAQAFNPGGAFEDYVIKRIGSDCYSPLVMLNTFIENENRYSEQDDGILQSWMRRYPENQGRFAWGLNVYEVSRPSYDRTEYIRFHADHHDIGKRMRKEEIAVGRGTLFFGGVVGLKVLTEQTFSFRSIHRIRLGIAEKKGRGC